MSKLLLLPILAFSQLVSWGTLYYAFAVISPSMQRDLGEGVSVINGAFSLALLIWGLSTYPAGLMAQRYSARSVLQLGTFLSAGLFFFLYGVDSLAGVYIIWALLGVAMAMTLYEPAFAAIVQSFSKDHRRRIGWITVVGGLASTVFWPLAHILETTVGWRSTFLVFSGLHLLTGLLLVRFLPVPCLETSKIQSDKEGMFVMDSKFLSITACFAIYGFVTATIAVQVIPILRAQGLDVIKALALASLIGPMQVMGRGADMLLANRWTPRWVSLLTFSLIPLSLGAFFLAYWHSALNGAFIIAYGIGLGLLTIVRAGIPLELFGPHAYARNGAALNVPWVLARAAGPIGSTWILGVVGTQQALVATLVIVALLGSVLYVNAYTPFRKRA